MPEMIAGAISGNVMVNRMRTAVVTVAANDQGNTGSGGATATEVPHGPEP